MPRFQYAANRFKILVVGGRSSGKSAFIRRLKHNDFFQSENASSTDVTVIVRALHGTIVKADLMEVGMFAT